ncbi:hypothetical protein [Phycicoccus avicenniae]|uniref:hypothetical protein n=1 Tax=Phycicoccus avicenniae TaxID=2828860 RepID=UPI003D2D6ED6
MVSAELATNRVADAPGVPRRADGLFLVAIALLCLVLPLIFLGDATQELSELALVGQWLVLAYAGVHLAVLLRRGAPLWFDTMFWAFSYGWIGLAGWAQMTARLNPYDVSISTSTYERAAMLALVGFLAYDLGKVLLKPRNLPTADPQGRRVSPGRTLVLGVVTLASMPVLVLLLGGPASFLAPRSQRTAGLSASGLITDESKVTGGILLAVTNALPLVALLAVIAVLQTHRELRRRPSWIALLVLLGSVTLFVGNPISNPRFWTGTIILSILFSLFRTSTARGYRVTLSAVLLALLVVFPYADRYRYADEVAVSQPLGYLFVNKLDYDASVQMSNVIDYVDATGGTHGHQLLGVAGFFVPRSLWSEKPVNTGALLTQFVGFPQTNVSSPLWVETYTDGGLLLVATFFVLLSMAATWAQRFRGRAPGRSVTWAMLVTPAVAAYSVVLLRGSLLSGIGAFWVILGISWFATSPTESLRRRRRRAPGSAARTRVSVR